LTEENDAISPRGPAPDPAEAGEVGPALPAHETNPEVVEEIQQILGESYDGDPETVRYISRIVAAYYRGPLPPPSMLRGYEDVLPGSADRILALLEKQSAHRQELESKTIAANIRSRYIGQGFAFVLCFIVIVGGLWAIFLGQSLVGFAAILLAVAGVAATFLGTRRQQQQELEEKRQALPPDEQESA